jgi:hypothetical protein
VESTIFIGAIIAGITQAIKSVLPQVKGWVTILIAVLVGVLVALLDEEMGIIDITVAQGIMTALGTVGVMTAVDRV